MTADAQTYSEIFERRGREYHAAMVACPRARDEEFEAVVARAGVRAGGRLCDAPSGAGYLADYLPEGVRVVSFETARVFAGIARARGARRVLVGDLSRLPLAEGSFDNVISLAALHHVPAREAFFSEALRVLARGGTLCVADACRGTAVAEFLNGFVHEHSSMGHEGRFIDENVAGEMERAGLAVDLVERVKMAWKFRDEQEMAAYMRLLFGVDRATAEQVLAGAARHLGSRCGRDGCRLGWELLVVRARRG